MSRDVLDLTEKTAVSPGVMGGGGVPFPGNINTMDPYGLDSLWTDVGDMLGLESRSLAKQFGGEDAIAFSIMLQCAHVAARDFSKSECCLWREEKNNQYSKVRPGEHWFARLLAREPNEFHTWIEFWGLVGVHLTLAQNSYIAKDITRTGDVVGLIPIPPARVKERVGRNNKLYYEIRITTEWERAQFGLPPDTEGRAIILPADRMIHIKGKMWNGLRGISNTESGKALSRLMNIVAAFQENLFTTSGESLLAFSTDATFPGGDQGEVAFQRLKRQLAERVRKREPLLLEAGLEPHQFTINSREAMTQEAFQGLVTRICGQMGISPHKIYASETLKYDNMATANNEYANDVLIPMALLVEARLRKSLFTDEEMDELWPEFDRMALMAGDMKTLGETLDKFVKNGTITQNEARTLLPLSLNPVPNGDRFMIPVNVAMVDAKTGEVVVQAAQGQNTGTGADTGADPENQPQERSLRIVSSNTER